MTKKQKQEELFRTHVININEIRKAEQQENQIKLQKAIIILLIIGMFCLATGMGIKLYNDNTKENSIAVNR